LKKIVFVLIIIILSCKSETSIESQKNLTQIKEHISESVKVGTLLKEDLKSKDKVQITYPEYVSESYSLLKFVAAIMSKEKELSVYIPYKTPVSIEENNLDFYVSNEPMLAYEEFMDFINFLLEKNIKITGNMDSVDGNLLILNPDGKNNSPYKIDDNILVRLVMVGSKYTSDSFNLIKYLPLNKRISSVRDYKNSVSIKIFMDLVENFTPVTPVKLYTKENYTMAPLAFQEDNSAFLQSAQINKMNKRLPQKIKKSFEIYGDNNE